MLESLLGVGKKKVGDSLINGDEQLGYYGVVAASDFISGDALASQLNFTAGTSIYSNGGWLKFAYQGKILYVAKRIIRQSVTWAQLYQAGLVYGDGTTGKYPSGTAVVQNKTVTIGGKQYKVRLFRGIGVDPSPSSSNWGDELAALMPKVMATRTGEWAKFPDLELSLAGEQPYASWVIETNSRQTMTRLCFTNARQLSHDSTTLVHPIFGWRPVLELIP